MPGPAPSAPSGHLPRSAGEDKAELSSPVHGGGARRAEGAGPSGAAIVAGVAGAPVVHSLSPYLHGRWIAAAGLDAAYVPFAPPVDGFARLVRGLAGGVVRGLNVTAPFKREALALADVADAAAMRAGSANLLLFHADRIEARSTDGHGVVTAIARRAPGVAAAKGVAVVLGAGGAGAAAVVALAEAGWRVRVVNRDMGRAEAVAGAIGGEAFGWDGLARAMEGAALVVNALGAGAPLVTTPPRVAAMDMGYAGHWTPFLRGAAARGDPVIHGIDMLIAQAKPSFAAFYGCAVPDIDVRAGAVALLTGRALGQQEGA